jgi:hypothetical protein
MRERVAHRLDAAGGVWVWKLGAFPDEYAGDLFNFHFFSFVRVIVWLNVE